MFIVLAANDLHFAVRPESERHLRARSPHRPLSVSNRFQPEGS
jgi:hypothetical protein